MVSPPEKREEEKRGEETGGGGRDFFPNSTYKMNIHSSWSCAHVEEIKVTFLDTKNPLLELHTFPI